MATARAALERPSTFGPVELQSAARLAEVYLRKPIDDRSPAAERFSKRLACALFLELQGPQEMLRVELDLPGLAWPRDRLDELAQRARAWILDRDLEPGLG